MLKRELLQRIYFAIVFFWGFCLPAYAGRIFRYQQNFNLTIPAGAPDESKGWMTNAAISVPQHLVISDLDVIVDIKHSSAFDLQIYLENPAGKVICLNRYGFTEFFHGQDYSQTIFDDEAAGAIEIATPPFAGKYRPKSGTKLSVFDGGDAYGLWLVKVYDSFYYDTGELKQAGLYITTETPEAASCLLLGLGFLLLPKRKK